MTQTDWPGYAQAAATLITGFAAVGAALLVGMRQAKIADKQAEITEKQARILDRQTTLDELELRTSLFERRFGVYEATARLLAEVLRDADRASDETVRKFNLAHDQSRFLFDPGVHEALQELWREYCDFGAVKSLLRKGEEAPDWNKLVDREHDLLTKFNDRVGKLSDIFGEEMKLFAPPTEHEAV